MNRDRLVAAAAPDILCLLGHRQVAIIFLISKHSGREERFGFTSASYQCNAFVNGTYMWFLIKWNLLRFDDLFLSILLLQIGAGSKFETFIG